MAEGGYGGQGSSQWTSVSDHERHKSAPGMSSGASARAPCTRAINPRPHAGTFAHRNTSTIVTIKQPTAHAMSEGRVQPCLSWSTFKVMSLMTCPFCCMPPLTGRLCRQTQATSLGQILIVLNRWDDTRQ